MRLPETRQMPAPASARCGRTTSEGSASPLALRHEQVALTALGTNIGGIGRVILDLLAQAIHPNVDAAVERIAFESPQLVHQPVARQRTVGMGDKDFQQLIFAAGQRDLGIVAAERTGVEVDAERSET